MNPKLSMQVFGLYLIVVAGFGLIFVPTQLLGFFGLEGNHGGWIRMVGMLASIIGAYYLLAARSDLEDLYRWSIPIRGYAAIFMVGMYLFGYLGAGILLIALIDTCGALWTWTSLRRESRSAFPG